MRDLFLLDPSLIFLNHGSFGACPVPVFEALKSWQLEMERNPVQFLGRRSAELLATARGALGEYLGTSGDRLVFVPNATYAVNTVARSLQLRAGDEVLTCNQEYGACDNTWERVCRAAGARYLPVDVPLPFSPDALVERIAARITGRTRVLYLSHITSPTALVLPVERLCQRAREAGVLTVVDGAHAPGQIPLALDRLGADFYAGNCHKWLCAPKGSAFLFARPEHHSRLDGLVTSWGYSPDLTGHAEYTGSSVLERRHQWQGTRDICAWLTVPTAIAFQRQHDWGSVQRRCHELAAQTLRHVCARSGLEPLCADDDFAQMVALPLPPTDRARLTRRLFDEHHIEIPLTSFGERLFARVSVQGYNTPSDCEALERALAQHFDW